MGPALSRGPVHAPAVYNPIVALLGILAIQVALGLSLLYSWQKQRDVGQSNRPNQFQINKIVTKTRSPVWFFTGPL